MTLCIQVLSPLDSVLLDSAFPSFCFANIGLGYEFVRVYHHFMGLSPYVCTCIDPEDHVIRMPLTIK